MKRYALPLVLVLLITAMTACDEDSPQGPGNKTTPPPTDYTYGLVAAFPDTLTFARGVDIQSAGDTRLFVVEQGGRVMVFDTASPATPTVFLNVSVTCCGEQGLLGLAFHPDYATNGYFFVYYSPNGVAVTRLSRFQVSADPNVADAGSEAILLEIGQRASNHNGGGLAFDGNGYLCVAVGDEGGGGDIYENAQNRETLQGSILRLDVDTGSGSAPYYAIPPDNPFAGNSSGYAEEIYAYGLRNPWRISYDAVTDRIWAGDVGQGLWEEIDIILSGGNYGWDCREGLHAYTGPPDGPSPLCMPAPAVINPVWEYAHGEGNISITGGYVYRGPTATSLAGMYIYADYSSGRVWALTYNGTMATGNFLVDDAPFPVSTFGRGSDGELYVMQYVSTGGRIFRIQQTEVAP